MVLSEGGLLKVCLQLILFIALWMGLVLVALVLTSFGNKSHVSIDSALVLNGFVIRLKFWLWFLDKGRIWNIRILLGRNLTDI